MPLIFINYNGVSGIYLFDQQFSTFCFNSSLMKHNMPSTYQYQKATPNVLKPFFIIIPPVNTQQEIYSFFIITIAQNPCWNSTNNCIRRNIFSNSQPR